MNCNVIPGFVIGFALLSAVPQLCAQSAKSQQPPRDWHKMDPLDDSIVGISLDRAYRLLEGRKAVNVIVAVIDNGIDINHEDLKNIIWTNTREIAGNGIDDDRNGFVDDVHGWNFRGASDGTVIENEGPAYGSSDLIANDKGASRGYGSPLAKLTPNLTHGTHVAGIIAAERNNGIGIDGIADHVMIMPLLAGTAIGDERDKDVANAIRYAVDNGARVINMSFSKTDSPGKSLVDEAVRHAEERDVLIIHAAGNDGVNIDSVKNNHYPIAIYGNGRRNNIFINVGWSRALFDYRLAHPRSDYGKLNVSLFAPGSDIFSTLPGDQYGSKSGSSMSAPVVSGVAAILFSYFPSLSAREVKDILERSVFKTGQMVNRPLTEEKVPFNSLSFSGGIVNAYKAVRMALDLK